MSNITTSRNQLIDALNEVKSLSHDLTMDELDELIDEVKCLYERFSDVTEARMGGKQ
jgi:signal transduction histidine kinase